MGSRSSTTEPAVTAAVALPTRSRTYGLLAGTVCGLLVLGLLLPYVVGEPRGSSTREAVSVGLPELVGEPDEMASPGASVEGDRAEGAAGGSTPTADAADATALDRPDGVTGQDGTAPAASTTAPAGGSGLTASDVGVSAEEIKLGILVPDVGGLADAGFTVAAGDLETPWRVFAAEANDHGGIHGRTVTLVFEEFDPLSSDDMRAACIAMAEQHQVFAVANPGGFYGDPVLCLTERYGVPFLGGDGEPTEWYQRSNGRYFSLAKSKTRALQDMVGELDRFHLLDDARIGVLDAEFPNDKLAVDNGLVPAIEGFGYSITHRATLSQNFGVGTSQTSVAVQQMQAKGVDVVLLATNFIYATSFVQQADNRGFHPLYVTSDFAGSASDGYTQRFPDSFEGSLSFTASRASEHRIGAPEDAAAADCRQRYESVTGVELDRTTDQYSVVMGTCALWDAFRLGSTNAGANLTRAGFVSALDARGSFAMPRTAGASYAPGKHDAADFIRTQRWRADCRCWMPEGSFRQGRF